MNAYENKAHELANWLETGEVEEIDRKEAANMLRQQADRIAKYEEALHAIANDYHELSDHKIEVQNRNHKKWAREALYSSGNNAEDLGETNESLPKGKE